MKHRFFQVNFLINAAFEHLRTRRLLGGDIYFTFPFPNAAFIGGRRSKEEIRQPLIIALPNYHIAPLNIKLKI